MEKKCIGIDVGGTTVKIGIFETDGTLVYKWEVPSRKEENGAYILPDVAASIRKKLNERGIPMDAVIGAGMGFPGPVQPDGYVEVCVNLGWRDLNPQKILSELLDGMPVRSGNDANVAALGEMWQGGGKGCHDIVMVTLGTGVGGGVAQFLCYNEVRRTSKHPEEFGKGCLEGIAAAESSNNAVVGSAMIPLLTLGIPGDGVTALLLGAFVLHGIQPGPTMFTKQGVMAYTIIVGCLVANVLLAPLGLGMTRIVAKIVQVRYTYLAPVIIMFCFAGAFAATGNTKELILCAGILIFSYILTVLDIDNTPLMLGMILEDIMEQNFVTASMSYDRNYSIFLTRPISAVILIITIVLLVSMIRVNRRVAKLNEEQEAQMASEHAKMENA